MLLSERSESHQRIAGAASDERLRGAGAHRRLAPDPVYGGRPPGLLGNLVRRAKSGQANLSCPGGTGPYKVEIWKCPHCTDTAYQGKAVAAGQLRGHLPDHRRTKQVGRHQAVYVRAEIL